MQFTPIKDFYSDEFQSQYCAGLSYTVRPEDKKLADLVPVWIAEGKVRLGVPETVLAEAKVAGSGDIV